MNTSVLKETEQWRSAVRESAGTLAAEGLAGSGAGTNATTVTVEGSASDGWQLRRNGVPYFMRGAGGDTHLEILKEIGGNTIRTWGIEALENRVGGRTLLERCEELGLQIMAGIWLEHERHGFDYSDPVQVEAQREKVRDAVRRYKDHPAILLWGLGNEMEGPNSDGLDPRIWKELNVLARIVKDEDPSHPICTVIAGAAEGKVRALIKDYPELDILGVNAYRDAPGAGMAVVAAGWKKPFVLGEYGPVGHWEVEQTSWGAPIEPATRDKSLNYARAHRGTMETAGGRCVGTFAFIWGHKQEKTSTWYGMFLASGEKLPAVDAVSHAWTGKWPARRCPEIEKLSADFIGKTVAPGAALRVEAIARSADGAVPAHDWQVVAESTERKFGGDAEEVPPSLPECVVKAGAGFLELRAPMRPGAYRIFLYVRDGRGGASADNFPFAVG